MLLHGKIVMENGAEIPFELYPDDAPVTVENFVKLIKEGYYDGKTFHRVIKNFVSQGGCPYGNGTGDLGYTIVKQRIILTVMKKEACPWHIVVKIPVVVSSSSVIAHSHI